MIGDVLGTSAGKPKAESLELNAVMTRLGSGRRQDQSHQLTMPPKLSGEKGNLWSDIGGDQSKKSQNMWSDVMLVGKAMM
jgi:hypothetical protein